MPEYSIGQNASTQIWTAPAYFTPSLRLLQVSRHYDLIHSTLNHEGVLRHLDGFRLARLNWAGGPHLSLINDLEDDHHGDELIVEVKISEPEERPTHKKTKERNLDHVSIRNHPTSRG